MVFNSLEFFLFLPVIWLFHHFLGQRFRWLFLLTASYLFYASLKVPYLLGIIALVTVTTYGFGMGIHRATTGKRKKLLLWAGISANIIILVVLKYLPFLTENLNVLLVFFDSPIAVHHAPLFVAIGASYFIFQAVSYLSDIYLEIEEPEPHLGYFALYLAFFPKLLQGPIERARDLLPQLRQKYEFNYENMRYGLLLFTWGLFKKVVLADRLGLYADAVYDDVYNFAGLPLILSTYAYALQIYFDFSGYTDMALGTARLFNIRLTNNFNGPYLATSIADFWRRWHITFSRWILDYIFKPLQMQWRNGKNWGTAAALVVTFLVSGIWHGASWGFVLWGLLHGLYMGFSVFYRPFQKKVHKALKLEKTKILKAWQVFVTFNMVCFAWIFFRAHDGQQALYVVENLFNLSSNWNVLANIGWSNFTHQNIYLGEKSSAFATTVIFLFLYALVVANKKHELLQQPAYMRWFSYYALVIVIICFHVSGRKYIYFQF